jgi:hypothetical protein
MLFEQLLRSLMARWNRKHSPRRRRYGFSVAASVLELLEQRVLLSATPASDSAIQVVDNSDTGFATESGLWHEYTGAGADGSFQFTPAGSGDAVASWTFNNLTAGEYRISATWPRHPNRSTDAPYTICDGSRELATVEVDQEERPSGSQDLTDLGAEWQDLGMSFSITSDTLVVKLTSATGSLEQFT